MIWLGMLAVSAGQVRAHDPVQPVVTTLPEFRRCRQMVLALGAGWNASLAVVIRFERAGPDDSWHEVPPRFPAICGKNGFAWGDGLQPPEPEGIHKREGDNRAPAGIFLLSQAFGSGRMTSLRFPYRQISDADVGVDDPGSKFYNRIVDRRRVTPDWHHAEVMLRPDGLYRFGVVIDQNPANRPGHGSCVFIHIWRERNSPTSGCTAMPEWAAVTLLNWLDSAKHPLLVQVPAEALHQLVTRQAR